MSSIYLSAFVILPVAISYLPSFPQSATLLSTPTPTNGINWNSSYDVLVGQEMLDAKVADIPEGIPTWFGAGYDLSKP